MPVNLIATPLPDLPCAAVARAFMAGWNKRAPTTFRTFCIGRTFDSGHAFGTDERDASSIDRTGASPDGDVAMVNVELLRTVPQDVGITVCEALKDHAGCERLVVILGAGNGTADGEALVDAAGSMAALRELVGGPHLNGGPAVEVWVDHLDPYFAPGAGLAGAPGGAGVGLRRPSEQQVPDQHQHTAKLALANRLGSELDDATLQRAVGTPGAGVGNGLGLVFAALGATFERKATKILEAQGFSPSLTGADLVVIVQETFDWRDLRESLAEYVCEKSAAVAVPVAMACGATGVGRREQSALGLASLTVASDQMIEPRGPLGPRLEHLVTSAAITDLGERLARTWGSA